MKRKNKIISLIILASIFASANSSQAAFFKKPSIPKQLEKIHNKKYLNLEDITDEELTGLSEQYKNVSKDVRILLALHSMQYSLGEFSRKAILGNNLSNKPIKIEFKNLSQIHKNYTEFDALGWKKKNKLYIYINEKHADAPSIALAALLSHEALHQDEFNSINEETYAWTMEAAVWTQLSEDYPEQINNAHPLVVREEMLKKLFIKGGYTNKYIRKSVATNPGYSTLPSRSPGFEDDL